MEEDGVRIILGDKIKKIENGFVHLESGENFEVETILVAAGRVPNVENLDLEAAGVEYD